jgi:GDP-L-fucose synthase
LETGAQVSAPSRAQYDLLEQSAIRRMLADLRPQIVFHAAGLIGGILANKRRPADFCYQNLLMNTALLHEAWRAGAEKYIALIGGCSYPAHAPSPIRETELWNGYPQEESAPYSLAKRMNVVQAEAYRRQYGFNAIVLVPGNIYGPYDNFDLENSHVIPALIRRFRAARLAGQSEVEVWGTGKATRDFIYIEDACRAILRGAEIYNDKEIINLSSGTETTIRELVTQIAELTGYRGLIRWDASKPEGQLFKGFDATRMHEWLGYTCQTSLREGLRKTVAWFEANHDSARLAG